MDEIAPPRARRWLPVAGTALSLMLALLGWYMAAGHLIHWVTERDIDSFVLRSRDAADQIATNLARNLTDEVRRLGNMPDVLIGDALLRARLLSVDKPLSPDARMALTDSANQRLEALAEDLEIDIAYLLDAHGVCVAASNYQSDRAVIGTDLHQRQYYIAIENGGRGRQFAFGGAAGVPGVYFSAEVRQDGKFYGGAVVKRSMKSLFRLTNRNAAFLIDEYGVVVASTLEKALWHYMPDSAAVRLGSDFLQDRYLHAALDMVELRAEPSESPVSLVHLFDDPQPALMTARPIGDSGLRLIYFTPVPDLQAMRQRADLTFWLLFSAGSLVLTLVAIAVLYVMQTGYRVAAVRAGYQRLAALSRELAAQKETAQAADMAKSRFLATMSHELRTPFSGILGMVDLLCTADLPAPVLQQVGLLERSARSLLSLLNDMLDFSKIDAGQLRTERVPFDVQPVIRDLSAVQRVVANAKGIGLAIDGETGPLIGLGDPNRLRQILDNFLSNAIKFTALGGVRMSVTIKTSEGQRRLRVTVSDSGPGVSPDAQAQLFQPFFQADASTTRKHGGTGLGLAISRRIAEAMGGQVGMESRLGHGSTFWLDVPFPETDQTPVNRVEPDPNDLFARLADKDASKRILLADDDEINRMVIGSMLQRAGHSVIYALDGRQAVQEVARQDFDLVIMDMHMPELDGVAATRAIRSMSGDKAAVPIVGLSADAISENRQACLAAGLNDLLAKPIAASDLLSVVRRFTAPADPALGHR